MESDALVVVFDAGTEVDALLFRSMLEEAGIDVVERPLEVEWLEGVRPRGLHSQLMVEEQFVDVARVLIDAFQQEADSGELTEGIPPEESGTAEEIEAKTNNS